jgi:hypothetical protein
MVILASCVSTGIALPYKAQIGAIDPQVPGLEIRATAGGGGELEIINRTAEEVMLLDEEGQPQVRLVSDGVYELLGSTWAKTKDTPVYYCHDPRIVYRGPEPTDRAPQVMKRWTISGRIGEQTFKVIGQTVYSPPRISRWPMTCLLTAIGAGSLGLLIAGVIIYRVVAQKGTTSQSNR